MSLGQRIAARFARYTLTVIKSTFIRRGIYEYPPRHVRFCTDETVPGPDDVDHFSIAVMPVLPAECPIRRDPMRCDNEHRRGSSIKRPFLVPTRVLKPRRADFLSGTDRQAIGDVRNIGLHDQDAPALFKKRKRQKAAKPILGREILLRSTR
jgi:hypothetical protein